MVYSLIHISHRALNYATAQWDRAKHATFSIMQSEIKRIAVRAQSLRLAEKNKLHLYLYMGTHKQTTGQTRDIVTWSVERQRKTEGARCYRAGRWGEGRASTERLSEQGKIKSFHSLLVFLQPLATAFLVRHLRRSHHFHSDGLLVLARWPSFFFFELSAE